MQIRNLLIKGLRSISTILPLTKSLDKGHFQKFVCSPTLHRGFNKNDSYSLACCAIKSVRLSSVYEFILPPSPKGAFRSFLCKHTYFNLRSVRDSSPKALFLNLFAHPLGIEYSTETTHAVLLVAQLKVFDAVQVLTANLAEEMIDRVEQRIKFACLFLCFFLLGKQKKEGYPHELCFYRLLCSGKASMACPSKDYPEQVRASVVIVPKS